MSKKVLIAIFVIILFGFAYLWRTSQRPRTAPQTLKSEPQKEQKSPGATSEKRQAKIKGGKLVEQDEAGNKIWEAEAKSIEADESRNLIQLREVKCIFFYRGNPDLIIHSEELSYNYQSRLLEITGGLWIISEKDKTKFKVDNLRWLPKENKLKGFGNVEFTKGNVIVSGDQLEFDLSKRFFKVRGNVELKTG